MPGLDPVVFLSPSSIGTAIEITVADINSPTELNSVAASSGDIVIARTVSAATDQYTYYIADTTSDAQSLPWIVSSSTSGVKFIASAGHAVNNSVRFASTIRLNSLTASRIVTLDSNKDSATPATISLTDQSLSLSSTATLTVIDSNFTITGSADASKTLKFEVDAQSANADLVIAAGAQTVDRTVTFPVLTTTNIFAVSDVTLTSGRIPYTTTNGLLTNSASLLWNNAGQVLTVGDGSTASGAYFLVNAPAGQERSFLFRTNGSNRWALLASTQSESGSNAGSNFQWAAYSDAGSVIDVPVTITRAAGGSIALTRPLTTSDTTDSTTKDTGSIVTEGGIAGEKNFISAQGIHAGVSSTATAAGTTTLTSASRRTQIFTGTTTQTLQLPAANLFGSGIAVEYIVINRSTGTVTAQRAGSDTFDGGGTTDAILTNTTRHYLSNGSNQWHTIA